jgi:DNA-binding XRE family transcriptional regulator
LTNVRDIPLSMKDYDSLKMAFVKLEKFSSHPLLRAASKIYAYLKTLAFEKPIVDIFIREREINVQRFGNRKATLDE